MTLPDVPCPVPLLTQQMLPPDAGHHLQEALLDVQVPVPLPHTPDYPFSFPGQKHASKEALGRNGTPSKKSSQSPKCFLETNNFLSKGSQKNHCIPALAFCPILLPASSVT